jgi:hypothetical protein
MVYPNGAKHLSRYGGVAGVEAIKANTDKRAAGLAATITSIKSEGVESARGVAKALNERGHRTRRPMVGEHRYRRADPARLALASALRVRSAGRQRPLADPARLSSGRRVAAATSMQVGRRTAAGSAPAFRLDRAVRKGKR